MNQNKASCHKPIIVIRVNTKFRKQKQLNLESRKVKERIDPRKISDIAEFTS